MTTFLFIDYRIWEHAPDPKLVTAGTAALILILTALIIRAIWTMRQAEPLELSSTMVSNVETLAMRIANQINRCKDEKDLDKAKGEIAMYLWKFPEDNNAVAEAEALKDLLDYKAQEIFEVV